MLFLPDRISGLPMPRYFENALLLLTGRTRMPLPSLSNNSLSPLRSPSTRRTSRGTVICPLLVILACFCISCRLPGSRVNLVGGWAASPAKRVYLAFCLELSPKITECTTSRVTKDGGNLGKDDAISGPARSKHSVPFESFWNRDSHPQEIADLDTQATIQHWGRVEKQKPVVWFLRGPSTTGYPLQGKALRREASVSTGPDPYKGQNCRSAEAIGVRFRARGRLSDERHTTHYESYATRLCERTAREPLTTGA